MVTSRCAIALCLNGGVHPITVQRRFRPRRAERNLRIFTSAPRKMLILQTTARRRRDGSTCSELAIVPPPVSGTTSLGIPRTPSSPAQPGRLRKIRLLGDFGSAWAELLARCFCRVRILFVSMCGGAAVRGDAGAFMEVPTKRTGCPHLAVPELCQNPMGLGCRELLFEREQVPQVIEIRHFRME